MTVNKDIDIVTDKAYIANPLGVRLAYERILSASFGKGSGTP